jgi:RNA polymerase sigma factor (sigma-70 family)
MYPLYERGARLLTRESGNVQAVRSEDFERLYERHSQPLFGFLAYRVGNRALAEDLMAEAFERALRARRRFDPRRGSEKTWLYTIALNCLRDQVRRDAAETRAVERATAGTSSVWNSGVEAVEARDAVERALLALSDEEREAIALRYGAGLTMPEIAKLTGQRLTTVEGRVYRALRKMRDEMDSADSADAP